MTNGSTQRKQLCKPSTPVRLSWTLSLAAAGLLASFSVGAADYSQYTNEELVQMRAQARDMSEQDREQFREEMRGRTQSMSADERNNLGLERDRSMTGSATDADGGRRMRSNEDNDNGRGELTRQRSRTEAGQSGFGSGYEQRQSGGGMQQRGGGGGRGR